MRDNKVRTSTIRLYFDRSGGRYTESKDLRGGIAGLCPEEILLHQHNKDGTVRYNYPLVQYKIIQGKYLIIGIEHGVEVINNLDLAGKAVMFSRYGYRISKKDVLFQELPYGLTEEMLFYTFLTPWLALNERNYERYQKLGRWLEKKEFLERILIGNIMSMSKSLGYTVSGRIKVSIGSMREVITTFKSVSMLGFLGNFSANFEIPDYCGVGRSVSRGFGTLERRGS